MTIKVTKKMIKSLLQSYFYYNGLLFTTNKYIVYNIDTNNVYYSSEYIQANNKFSIKLIDYREFYKNSTVPNYEIINMIRFQLSEQNQLNKYHSYDLTFVNGKNKEY